MPVEGSPFTTNHYSNRPAMEAAAGLENVALIADMQNQGDATYIANRIEAALTESDRIINAAFAKQNQPVPTSGAYFQRLETIGAYLALVYLYRPKAMSDANFKGLWQIWQAAADKEIDEICWALSRDACMAGPTLVVRDPSIAATMRASLPCWPPLFV